MGEDFQRENSPSSNITGHMGLPVVLKVPGLLQKCLASTGPSCTQRKENITHRGHVLHFEPSLVPQYESKENF